MNLAIKVRVCVLLLLSLAFSGSVVASGQIAVGSKAFPESRLLAEIMAQLIESRTELEVDRKLGLAGTLICFEALKQGDIDLYPEYTGTGLLEILHETLGDDLRSETVYQRVATAFPARFDVAWLKTFGFKNDYALAVHEDSSLTKISDLASTNERLRARFQHEFLLRPDGYPGVSSHYGFQLDDVRGMEHGLAYIALSRRQIDLMEAYTTDAVLQKYPIRILEDDRSFFPPYDAAPVVRQATLNDYPQLEPLINELAGRLTQAKISNLNYQVAVQARSIEAVARQFLTSESLIAASSSAASSALSEQLRELFQLLLQHLGLSLTATLLASIVGIALGIYVARNPTLLAGPILGTASALQTIPGLALLAFMIPLLGIGWLPVVAALFLYGLLPIVRNTYTGIVSVPADLKEAGLAMGMTQSELLRQLELPLAAKTIMAGVRTALVINIGTATLGAFIGAGGLGEPITRGLQQGDHTQILWGAIPAAILALVCDFLMSRLERRLEPRGLRAASNR